MKKRIVSVLLTLCLLLTMLPASVSAAGIVDSGTLGSISYTLDSKGLLTISGSGSIPDYAFYDGFDYEIRSLVIKEGITGIGECAFWYCLSLKSAVLPESLVSIESGAFAEARSLESINIPSGVDEIKNAVFLNCMALGSLTLPNTLRKIGRGAFRHCENLKLTIPNSVTEIGDNAFIGCDALTSVTLPDNLTVLGEDAFSFCSELTEFVVSDKNTACSTIDGVLYSKDASILLTYPAGKPGDTFAIPEGVIRINSGAFYKCKYLKKVSHPDSVTEIGNRAFEECCSLETIILPKHLQHYDAMYFYYRTYLTDIQISPENPLFSTRDGILYDKQGTTLLAYPRGRADTAFTVPDGVETIAEFAFYDCAKLKSVTLPDTLQEISTSAFEDCENLERLAIPDRVLSIDNYAFAGCSSLTEVTLPSGLTTIQAGLFQDCYNLSSVTLPDALQEISYTAFENCESLESIVIPDSVSEIGSDAFSGCTSLTAITLPSSLTTIYAWRFSECYHLSSVTIPDHVTHIEAKAFEDSDNVTFICNPGSYAEQFAKENGIPHRSPGQPRFDDVAEKAWYAGYVDYVYCNKLMNGVSTYLFNPNGAVTRGQLVTILHRIEGEPNNSWIYGNFSDVTYGKYYSLPVGWASNNGIVDGFSDGTFRPNNPITREQIATILYRYDGSPNVSGSLSGFPDAGKVSSYARDAMIWAVSQGLITGVKSGDRTTLSPKSNATRAQIAAIIRRYQELPIPARNDRLIGIAMPTDALLRWERDGSQLKQQLEELGYEVDLQYADNDSELQNEQIKSMIENGCKVIVVATIYSDALFPAMARAKRTGVKVIAYEERLLDTDAVTGYVTFDKQDIGVKQGQWIIDALDLEHAEDKTYNIEFVVGDFNDPNSFYAYEGALSVLQPYMDAGILQTPSGQTDLAEVADTDWDSAKAQKRFESLLSTYYSDGTPLHAILAINDSVAQGAVQALAKGYKNDIYPIITGQDCDLLSVRNILSGKQAMSVFQDTRILAAHTAQIVDTLMRDQELLVNDDTTYYGAYFIPIYPCEPAVCTRDNYRELLIDSGYYSEDQLS